MLLIHGAGGSAAVWPAAIRERPGIQTIALDLPGHGRSPQPGRRSIAHYADAVSEFIRREKLHRVVVAGHSMGGAIALELARRRLPELAGAILLGAGGRLRVNPLLFTALSEDFPGAVQTITSLSFAEDAPEALRRANTSEMLRCGSPVITGDLLACNRFDLTAALPSIALPVLLISGTADRMVPHRHSAATAAALPNATLQSVDKAGHLVMQEAPHQVAEHMADFRHELT